MIDYKCSYSVHVSRKELYLQLIAYSPVSWRRGRFKDRWEDGNGTGPHRSTPANFKTRRGPVSLSGETSPVSGIEHRWGRVARSTPHLNHKILMSGSIKGDVKRKHFTLRGSRVISLASS